MIIVKYIIGSAFLYLFVLSIPRGKEPEIFPFTIDNVTIIDGDTIHIGTKPKVKVRLEGIDAPEKSQKCVHRTGAEAGKEWNCGEESKKHLKTLISKCVSSGPLCQVEANGKDKYERHIGIVWIGKTNANQQMVEDGLAIAQSKYSKDQVIQESNAQAKGIGIWESEFENPSDYREKQKMKDSF